MIQAENKYIYEFGAAVQIWFHINKTSYFYGRISLGIIFKHKFHVKKTIVKSIVHGREM